MRSYTFLFIWNITLLENSSLNNVRGISYTQNEFLVSWCYGYSYPDKTPADKKKIICIFGDLLKPM